MNRHKFKKQVFMEMAVGLSKLSTCKRLSVGSFITDDSFVILGGGYNGRVSGEVHCKDNNPRGEKGLCRCIHAEVNALKHTSNFTGKKLCFVTAFPCPNCLEKLHENNVVEVYYKDPYNYFESSSKKADELGIKYEQILV